MTPPAVTVTIYRSTPVLDAELADLGYAAITGWPDQRPITAALVRSRLRPSGTAPATTLAVSRDRAGRLQGAAALRWPPHPTGTGRLWGPVVHPHAQRAGIGRALLDALTPHITTAPGRMATAEVPATRVPACVFFEAAGWTNTSGAALLRARLPLASPNTDPDLRLRHPEPGEALDKIVADLYDDNYREVDLNTVRNTLNRWTADDRFTNHSLALAADGQGILGVALVYPQAHTDPGEPTEALLGDLLIRLSATSNAKIGALAGYALNAAADHGAQVARAVTADVRLATALTEVGFTRLDAIRYYQPGIPDPDATVAGEAAQGADTAVRRGGIG